MKVGHRERGHLAPRIAVIPPWEEVHVDCIGKWTFQVSKNVKIQLQALTMIDP